MKVDAYNAISQYYETTKIQKQGKVGNASFSDKIEISKEAKDYQIAKQAVKNAPDIREDKVSDMKTRLESGTYNVSNSDLVDKLLDKYFAL